MVSDKSKSRKRSELPSNISVPSSWAVTQYGKGRLQLSPVQIKRTEISDTIKISRQQFEALSPPLPLKSQIEWIEPLDAVHWLAARVGGDAAAKTFIAERLRDGAIECSLVWMSHGPDVGPVTGRRPKYPVVKPGVIQPLWVTPIRDGKMPLKLGRGFWLFSDDWDSDLKRWDWAEGRFVVSKNITTTVLVDGRPIEELKSKVRSREVASGIRFSRADIEKLWGDASSLHSSQSKEPDALQSTQPKFVSRRSRKKSDPWAVWFAELLILAEKDGLDISKSAEDLHEEISRKIYDRDPDQNHLDFGTVEKTIGIIFRRLSEAKSGKEI
jgi:hypothetical protein